VRYALAVNELRRIEELLEAMRDALGGRCAFLLSQRGKVLLSAGSPIQPVIEARALSLFRSTGGLLEKLNTHPPCFLLVEFEKPAVVDRSLLVAELRPLAAELVRLLRALGGEEHWGFGGIGGPGGSSGVPAHAVLTKRRPS
jgi:hypothetical protein